MSNSAAPINADDVFEPEEAWGLDHDDVVERVFAIKPAGKGDSGMAEERS